jgi:excisionase family DNA binding protein
MKEACALLAVTRPTIYAYVKAGKIIKSKIVGKTYISRESINNALTPQP